MPLPPYFLHFYSYLCQEQEKFEQLELRKRDLDREVKSLKTELSEAGSDLKASEADKRSLKEEVKTISDSVYSLEAKLEDEKRKQNRYVANISSLQEQVTRNSTSYVPTRR